MRIYNSSKKLKYFTAFILTLIFFTVILSGCSNGDDNSNGRKGVHEIMVEPTNKPFIANSSTQYKLIIPQNARNFERFAAEEIQYFLYMATNCKFDIVTEEGTAEGKIISLGQTNALAANGFKPDYSVLGRSGFHIVTKGDSVFIFGRNDLEGQGTLFGAYEFLHHTVGYKFYAETEIALTYKNDVNLPDFQVRDTPDFDSRRTSYLIHNDLVYYARLRLSDRTYYDVGLSGGSHSHFTVLPQSKYYEQHKDWYSPRKDQLCLTNDEMTAEFIEQLKPFIEAKPLAGTVLIGLMDTIYGCECERCTKATEDYGSYGGVNIAFVNKVAKGIDEWLAEKYPERTMEYVTLAYLATEKAPVKFNEEKNVYEPTHPDVIPRDNVLVRIASISMRYAYPITHSENANYMEVLRDWSVVAKKFDIYQYNVNFATGGYFVGLNNFSSMESNYKTYFEYGAVSMLEQGPHVSNTACLYDMKMYVMTQLMWDTSKSYDDLVNEFLVQYFKDASDTMREFYDYYRNWYAVMTSELGSTGYVGETLMRTRFFPKSVVDQFNRLINKALADIKHLKDTDAELYQSLFDKIKKESLMSTAMYLNFYQSSFSKTQVNAMIDELEMYCNKYNITYWGENVTLAPVIQSWRDANK